VAQTRAKPPISSHGLFPVIVAIWFAALFGFGCLVLPIVLLERVSDASGIAKMIPAAAPPLGPTARIMLSSCAGVFGALLGFVVARRVAKAQANARPADTGRQMRFAEETPAARVRRPILAMEELGVERIEPAAESMPAIAATTPIHEGKRPLVSPEESAPFHVPPIPPEQGKPAHWADEHPLMPSMASMTDKVPAQHGWEHALRPVAAEPADEPESPEFDALQADDEAEQQLPAPAPGPAVEANAFLEELPPLAAPLPEQRRIVRKRPPASALADPLRALLSGRAAPTDKIAGPLELLGMVQLAERLGRSIHEHGAVARPTPEKPVAGPANGSAPLDETASTTAGYARLAALAEMANEDEPRDTDADDGESDEDVAAAGYSSLLAIGNPAAPVSEAPRPFDAPAPALASGRLAGRDPAETERALRSALATLQRMSGAA
jgi:hypothetical protein